MKNKNADKYYPERELERHMRHIEYERHNHNELIYNNRIFLLEAFGRLFKDSFRKKFN